MDINTSHCRNAASSAKESASKLREVYSNLDWSDDVYRSVESFVDDVEKAAKNIETYALEAAAVAESLADIDLDAIEARFTQTCAVGSQSSD